MEAGEIALSEEEQLELAFKNCEVSYEAPILADLITDPDKPHGLLSVEALNEKTTESFNTFEKNAHITLYVFSTTSGLRNAVVSDGTDLAEIFAQEALKDFTSTERRAFHLGTSGGVVGAPKVDNNYKVVKYVHPQEPTKD